MDPKPSNVVGRRVAAFIIDGLLGFALLWILGDHETGDGGFSVGVYGGAAVLYYAILAAYYWVYQGLTGVTIGKLALGIKVVREDGSSPPGIPRAAARSLLWIVDAFPYLLPGLTGFIVAMSSERHQRVGDLVASTLVVRQSSSSS